MAQEQIKSSILIKEQDSGGRLTIEETRSNVGSIVVIERQSFTRGCLCSWIQAFCTTYRLSGFPDVSSPQLPPIIQTASLAIISTIAGFRADDGLVRDVTGLRTLRPGLPIIAIIDETEPSPITEMVMRLGLEGYIPTTTTLEVAAAVVHLVAAGGTYIPQMPNHAEPVSSNASQARANMVAAGDAKLTPRERRVLDLLSQGMSNKTIACRLCLSESTVKVHVHRIISKFNVHNRTEAVVAAYHRHAHHDRPTLLPSPAN